jgi:uncharacterized membrane protein
MKNLSAVKPWGIPDVFKILLWATIVTITWYFMHGADHFLQLTPEALGKYFKLKWILILHITAGGGALILGPLQFWDRLRTNNWKLHRIIGTLYLLAILASSICAVILASTTAYVVNWAYAFSLQVWVTVWISSSFIALWTARKRQFKLHKEWMTRSYLVTLAFVVSGLVVKLPVVQSLGSFADISPSLFWMGWAVPLYLYEVFLSIRQKKATRV